MGCCHLCRCAPGTDAATILPTLTHGRAWPRPVPFASYARPLMTAAPLRSTPLCDRCRARLDAGESRLVRRALRPALFGWDAQPSVRYGAWLPRLVASLAYRVIDTSATSPATRPDLMEEVRQAAESWRAFATGQRSSVGRFLLHLFPIVPLVEEWRQAAYAQRMGGMQAVIARTGDAFVWMKLPGMVALGAIRTASLAARPVDERAGTWVGRQAPVPGVIRFLMFEELQRALSRCHEAHAACPAAADGE